MENEEYIDEKRGFVAETDAVLGIRIWCVGPRLALITMHTYDVWERGLVYISEKVHLHIAKVYIVLQTDQFNGIKYFVRKIKNVINAANSESRLGTCTVGPLFDDRSGFAFRAVWSKCLLYTQHLTFADF